MATARFNPAGPVYGVPVQTRRGQRDPGTDAGSASAAAGWNGLAKNPSVNPTQLTPDANNHGVLSALLRAEKILLPVKTQQLAHAKGDPKPFTTAMQKLIKDKNPTGIAMRCRAR